MRPSLLHFAPPCEDNLFNPKRRTRTLLHFECFSPNATLSLPILELVDRWHGWRLSIRDVIPNRTWRKIERHPGHEPSWCNMHNMYNIRSPTLVGCFTCWLMRQFSPPDFLFSFFSCISFFFVFRRQVFGGLCPTFFRALCKMTPRKKPFCFRYRGYS